MAMNTSFGSIKYQLRSLITPCLYCAFTFLFDIQDAIVSGIEDKIAAWTFLPKGIRFVYYQIA